MAGTKLSVPGWLVDGLIALVLVGIAVAVERQTEGRLSNESIALWVGGGTLLLLRLGAVLAQAGRGLGCAFVFAITWLLPCFSVLYFAANSGMSALVRDSLPFFILLGFFLIIVMIVTFERIRQADVARYQ